MKIWYHKTMDGVSNTYSDNVKYLENILKEARDKKSEQKYKDALNFVKKLNNPNEFKKILDFAIIFDSLPIVKFLIEDKKVNINLLDSNNETPLIDAVIWGRLEIVKYLIDQGANVNHKDNSGETPLWCALEHRHIAIAEYLRSKGADVNYKNTIAKEDFTLKEQAKGEFGLEW